MLFIIGLAGLAAHRRSPLSSNVRPHNRTPMSAITSIPKRIVRIAGEPNKGWSGADPDDLNAVEVEFSFKVTSDGNRNYLLVYQSIDGKFAADTWHETVEEALACARDSFGIEEDEWSNQPQL